MIDFKLLKKRFLRVKLLLHHFHKELVKLCCQIIFYVPWFRGSDFIRTQIKYVAINGFLKFDKIDFLRVVFKIVLVILAIWNYFPKNALDQVIQNML